MSCTVDVGTMIADTCDNDTLATGATAAITVTSKATVTLPDLTMIEVVPGDTPVITPELDTVAISGTFDVQVITASSTTSSRSFFGVAVSSIDVPTVSGPLTGVTVIDVTGNGGGGMSAVR